MGVRALEVGFVQLRWKRSGRTSRDEATQLLAILGRSAVKVVDVGARDGLCLSFRPIASGTDIVGFEPDAVEARRLERLVTEEGWRSVRVLPHAVGLTREARPFYVLRRRDLCSLLPPNPRLPSSSDWDIVETRSVRSVSLDDLCAAGEIGSDVDFVKIDAQGGEFEILKSGENTVLPRVFGLQVETRFLEHYAGQTLFSEIEEYLRARGFSLYGLENVYVGGREADSEDPWPPTRRRLSHGDALFLRDPGSFPALAQTEGHRLRRFVAILLLFGFCEETLSLAHACGADVEERVRRYVSVAAGRPRWRATLAARTLSCLVSPTRRRRFELAKWALTVDGDDHRRWRLSPPGL